MPPANVDATIIILDIGKNVAIPEGKSERSFFDEARECVCRIIERKIISRPKDLISIMLMGSKRTKNKLADCTDDFRHIEYLTSRSNDNNENVVSLDPPTWDLLRKLPKKATKYEADWFEALIVAADVFKNGLYGTKVTHKKIVLMTNFKAPAHIDDSLDQVLAGFQAEGFEVDVIGPHISFDDTLDKDHLQVVRQFVEATEGIATTFDDAMRYLLFHRKKATKPMPWNVDLSIGPHIRIPVSVYGRIRDEKIIGVWQKAYKDPVTNTASVNDGVFRKKDYFRNEDNAPITVDELITGYHYGQSIVPFSDTDKSMLYESGPRGLQMYGFTEAENIKWHHLAGNGVSYLFGRKDDKNAQKAIVCLVKALQELNLYGVARRVYNNGNAPVMHVLIPTVDRDDFYCLSLIALCFHDDIKSMAFPSTNLKIYDPSNEEIDAFKDLIDSMDLMTAYDESYDDQEAFPIAETVNPTVQYVLDCLAFRALNPGKPLPQPRDDIMMLFKMPDRIEKRSREPLQRLEKLLQLKEVEKKPKKPRANKNVSANSVVASSAISDNSIKTDSSTPFVNITMSLAGGYEEVTDIGTVDPIGDFKTLLVKGKDFKDLATELTSVIENLIYLNFDDDYSKATDTMRVFREESLKSEPTHYNNWLQGFRKSLAERGKVNVLEIFRAESLSLITKAENDRSTVAKEELDDNPLYEMDTVPNSTQLIIQSDDYAIFDEM